MSTVNAIDGRLAVVAAMQTLNKENDNQLRDVAAEIEENAAKMSDLRELQILVNQYESALKELEEGTGSSADVAAARDAMREGARAAGYGPSSDLYQSMLAPDADTDANGNKIEGTGSREAILADDNFIPNIEAQIEAQMADLQSVNEQNQVKMQLCMSAQNASSQAASNVLAAYNDNIKNLVGNLRA